MTTSRVISGMLLSLLPAVASAQDFSATFWLARDLRSGTDCMAFDPQFTREHRLTVNGGQATLTSPGGIQTSLKPVKPGVYEEDTVMDAACSSSWSRTSTPGHSR